MTGGVHGKCIASLMFYDVGNSLDKKDVCYCKCLVMLTWCSLNAGHQLAVFQPAYGSGPLGKEPDAKTCELVCLS